MTYLAQKLETGIPGGLCGVYSITTPSGKAYIGSSVDIRRRWYEHHWRMKNGKSSSPQLDRAYAKYGLALRFDVLEECLPAALREREQWYLDNLNPALNVSKDAYCAALWASKLGASISAGAEARRCRVQDSEGRYYESITAASREMGCSDSALRRRLDNHDPFPCGLRFRREGEDWRPLRPSIRERKQQAISALVKARRERGGPVHSQQARLEKSQRTRGVPWSKERRERFDAKKRAKEAQA